MPRAEPRDQTLEVAIAWIENHCVVPDGFRMGAPFRLYDVQYRYMGQFYRVRADAEWIPEAPVLAPAFRFRRCMWVAPQKIGKNPLNAAQCTLEGVGPSLFAGWARRDEGYVCAENGCPCGWEYAYRLGEPKGMVRPTALIQITAVSEQSTGNTYDALRPMIEKGPLAHVIVYRGEEFMRLPRGGKIEVVTASAQSRLGNPVTFASQDELGLWTARNGMSKVANAQWRNLAGMQGRASCTSNAWDPAEHSAAQEMAASLTADPPIEDIYIQFDHPPAKLSYGNKRERARIHEAVYPPEVRRENGGHVDLDSIEAEAADLIARGDAGQAARFFGNLLVKGGGRAFDPAVFERLAVTRSKIVPDRALITLGFDGAKHWDSTVLIGCEVASGYEWPIAAWERPPIMGDWEVPMLEVDAAVARAFATWDVWRMYADPRYFEESIATWQAAYMRDGKPRVLPFPTNQLRRMAMATRVWAEAMSDGSLSHCAEDDPLCEMFERHVGNAVRKEINLRDDFGWMWVTEKDGTNSPDKIDSVPAGVLAWQARIEAIAAGALTVTDNRHAYSGMSAEQIKARLRGDPWPPRTTTSS